MVRILVNAAVFQGGWIASVLFGNPAAIAVAVTASALYYRFFRSGGPDILLILAVVLLGFTGDTLLGVTGILVHDNGLPFPPPWMVTLWLLFAMTLPWSLRPLAQRGPLFLALCIIGGSVSYLAGERLSPVEFGYPAYVILPTLALTWLIHGLLILRLFAHWRRNGVAA